ncbi:MAG: RDD family protein [Candidatus Baltobacteraceae bacterium]
MRQLFRGPFSLTYRGERIAFYLTLLFAFPAAAAIGFVLREDIHPSQIAVLGVMAMVYVTLARGRLVGSSVRVHASQYPRVFAIAQRCAAALDLPVPMVFVPTRSFPLVTVGLGEPYSLVISSNWIEHFRDDELAFMIGRELGHIASGHARFTSLLSVNGNENAIVSLIFGAWLRRAELTCDRVGLLCCGSLDAAMRAITVASFHAFGRQIDHRIFAEQARDVNADSVLRMGELLGSMPYATRRIESMRVFFGTELYRLHEEQFLKESAHAPALVPRTLGAQVTKSDLAGWWRRMAAFVLDWIIVQALVTTLLGVAAHPVVQIHSGDAVQPKAVAAENLAVRSSPALFSIGGATIHSEGVTWRNAVSPWNNVRSGAVGAFFPLELCLYFGLLVALGGQTPGMMILGLKVVRTDFGKPAVAQSLWRYAAGFLLCWIVFPLSPFSRLYLHDRLSKTRIIKTERALARVCA